MRTFPLVLLVVVFAVVVQPAWAQNQLANPDFDNDVDWWNPATYVSLVWSPDDAGGVSWSGSAAVTNAHPGQGQGTGISQCVNTNVIPGATYDFAGAVFIPDGQTRTGNAQIGLRWYDGPDCTGSSVGNQPRRSTATTGSWVHLEALDEVAPPGAVSVLFLAFPSKVEAGGTLVAHFDQLLLKRAIFYDGFESGDLWWWSTSVQQVVFATPWVDPADIADISRVFCQSGNCPWVPPDAVHDGIDIAPVGDLVPFQSGVDGVVTWIDEYFNPGNGYWQINVLIEYGHERTYRLNYAFEPMSADVAVKDQQLAEIVVQEGQQVAAGQPIGRLVAAGADAHVHWGFIERWQQVCPDPFLAAGARADLLAKIHENHPGWNICY